MPNFSGSYTTDAQQKYTDSLGNIISKQKIKLGQVAFGVDFNTPIPIGNQAWLLGGGVAGIYSTTKGTGAAAAIIIPYDGIRARVHLNASLAMQLGGAFTIGTFYDGIGVSQFEAYGLELGFNYKF